MARAQKVALLKKRRARAARITLGAVLLCCGVLALWSCVEDARTGSATVVFEEALKVISSPDGSSGEEGHRDFTLETSESSAVDPLQLNQEGFELRQVSPEGNTLWYQSSWSISQSRILLERALALQGWEPLHGCSEAMLSFMYAPTATAGGGLLLANFYTHTSGCSLLIEIL